MLVDSGVKATTALGSTITLSAVVVFVINFFKSRSWFPWLTAESKVANRFVAVALSGASALGIHFLYDNGTLTITGLSLAGVGLAGWMWLKSFALQEWIYQSSSMSNKAAAAAQQGTPPAEKNGK
ncbi:MAG TPA: hypothetical protein VN788_00105 [Verrucomicrobiae bacterium]|nr:hypothetical protein [Verrucomicrobiae bacterium]